MLSCKKALSFAHEARTRIHTKKKRAKIQKINETTKFFTQKVSFSCISALFVVILHAFCLKKEYEQRVFTNRRRSVTDAQDGL